MAARAYVLNHNLETVPRLYRSVRPQAGYERSLALLAAVKELDPAMQDRFDGGARRGAGGGAQVMADLRAVGCDIITLGQYLRPVQAPGGGALLPAGGFRGTGHGGAGDGIPSR